MADYAETTVNGEKRFAHQWRKLGGLATPWLDLAFPPECAACRAEIGRHNSAGVCAACRQRVTSPPSQQCWRCAAPLAGSESGSDGCRRCRGEKFAFEMVSALGPYNATLREAVLRMKQPAGESLSLALGRLMADRLEAQDPRPDLVVPMPMAWRRRLIRGVNAPDLLAEVISRRLAIPLRRPLRLRRKVLQQSTLAPTRRRENVRGALAVFPGYPLADANVLLVDDILTTGATANEAARRLKQAGASEVRVAVAARGIGFD